MDSVVPVSLSSCNWFMIILDGEAREQRSVVIAFLCHAIASKFPNSAPCIRLPSRNLCCLISDGRGSCHKIVWQNYWWGEVLSFPSRQGASLPKGISRANPFTGTGLWLQYNTLKVSGFTSHSHESLSADSPPCTLGLNPGSSLGFLVTAKLKELVVVTQPNFFLAAAPAAFHLCIFPLWPAHHFLESPPEVSGGWWVGFLPGEAISRSND